MENKSQFDEYIETLKTVYTPVTIPPLKNLSLSPLELKEILQRVIQKHINKYDWIPLLSSIILAIVGICASFFAGCISLLWRILIVVLSAIVGGALVFVPKLLKRRVSYTDGIVDIIENEISCFQEYGMSLSKKLEEDEKRTQAASNEVKESRRRLKQVMKDGTKKHHTFKQKFN